MITPIYSLSHIKRHANVCEEEYVSVAVSCYEIRHRDDKITSPNPEL